jgi:glycosyltransferase involved in cell wall biosynthesis
MSKAPKITVGMPVYNAEPWLSETLGALLDQTCADFVLVISDNASTDRTGQICQAFAEKDPRIQYHRNPQNIGVFRNYNRVFHLTKTPYFKWAAANDLCAPTFLEECLAALEANPTAVVAYPGTIVFTDDPALGKEWAFDPDIRDKSPVTRFIRVLSEMRLNNAFNGLMRSEALRKTLLNRVYRGSDSGLLAELALQGQIMRIPRNLFFRRLSPAAASALRDAAGLREFFASEGRDVLGRPTWDFHWHCFSAALTAHVTLSERIQCAAHVAHKLWWKRWDLCRELGLKVREPYNATTT